jgi:hypothetical protein
MYMIDVMVMLNLKRRQNGSGAFGYSRKQTDAEGVKCDTGCYAYIKASINTNFILVLDKTS